MATVENAPLNETAMNEDVVVTVEKITPQELAAHGMEVLEADSDAVKEAVKKHDAIEEAKLASERPPPPPPKTPQQEASSGSSSTASTALPKQQQPPPKKKAAKNAWPPADWQDTFKRSPNALYRLDRKSVV